VPLLPAFPQRYDPTLDLPGADETETAEALADTMLGITRKTYADGGHAIRSVHAKSHGLLKAEFEVPGDLAPVLAQGLFARPGRYGAVMRFSTIPGDILDDSVSTPRGLAVKVLGVPGARLDGAEASSSQDFIMVNAPRFNAPSAKAFLRSLKLVAATTDRAPGAKKALSAVLRNIEKLVENFGGESATLKVLGGEPPTHILGETFFSQLPIRFGDFIAKLRIAPVSPELKALTDQPIDVSKGPNVLREAVIEHFRLNGGEWELRAQLCSDLEAMPIDDPTKDWDEKISEYDIVARITAEPQLAWSEARSGAIDDGMGFSPWNGIEEHRPLGQIMRTRKLAYIRSQQFRAERNGVPISDPASLDEIPD
jgi:hypothetical protein